MDNTIRERREAAGITLRELSRRAGISYSFLSEIETGKKTVNARRLRQIAVALRCRPSDLLANSGSALIPIVGKVGAGAHVALIDAYAQGAGAYYIEPTDPELDPSTVIGVEVDGESMAPLVPHGSVLIFSRQFRMVDDADLGRVVILETEEGRAMVKQIKRGREPGTYDLHSARDGFDPLYGVRVKWAARFRDMILPEDVRKIEEPRAA